MELQEYFVQKYGIVLFSSIVVDEIYKWIMKEVYRAIDNNYGSVSFYIPLGDDHGESLKKKLQQAGFLLKRATATFPSVECPIVHMCEGPYTYVVSWNETLPFLRVPVSSSCKDTKPDLDSLATKSFFYCFDKSGTTCRSISRCTMFPGFQIPKSFTCDRSFTFRAEIVSALLHRVNTEFYERFILIDNESILDPRTGHVVPFETFKKESPDVITNVTAIRSTRAAFELSKKVSEKFQSF